MSLMIDRKYVGLVSLKLEQFKKKKDYLWNFRCPFCKDSRKNKLKCRGYFYKKQAHISYICHNCSVSCSVGNFIKQIDPSLYRQYQMELYTTSGEVNSKKPDFPKEIYEKPTFSSLSIPCVKKLSESHSAIKYLRQRRIPEKSWNDIYYADDFLVFCDQQFPEHGKNLLKEDSRLVFPFYDQHGMFLGVQGRAIPPFNHKVKYITMKASEDSVKVFGLNTVDFSKTIDVVEGPIDSLFLNNCVAMMDSALYTAPQVIGEKYKYRFIYDNEKRNPQIVKNIGKTIRLGYSVCLFPDDITQKDINDLVLSGITDIEEMIEKNTYSGLQAELKFQTWRKV